MNDFQELGEKIERMSDEEKKALLDWLEKIKSDTEKRQRCLENFFTSDFVSGVYEIVNTKNQKRYIGQSECINKRICTHRSSLANGYHSCPELQKDYNQFGPETFEVFILEKVSDEKDRLFREKYWIHKYLPDQLYNTAR